VLSRRLNQPVDCFAFPEGKIDGAALRKAQGHYQFVFGGIPTANRDWNQALLYRWDADEMTSPTAFLPNVEAVAARPRSFLSRLRYA